MAEKRDDSEAVSTIPVFSERLTTALETMFKGEAPNAGLFCGYCYTPIDRERVRCSQCERSVEEWPPEERVPEGVLEMFRQLRRRESLIVNGFAYAGMLLAVLIFIAVFALIFFSGANIWLMIIDIVGLFILARVLAGILGGVIGDEVGFRYSRRKLAEDWAVYEAQRRGKES